MITPARGKAIVKTFHLEHSGLILPDTFSKPKVSVAEILESESIEKGSKVLIPTMTGLPIKEGEDFYRLINESDIMAVIDDNELDGSETETD